MPERNCNLWITPNAGVIWPAMRQRIRHLMRDNGEIILRPFGWLKKSG
jgi:hypothetical protein